MTKVLVVEDNPANRYLVSFLLERSGYKVLHAANGRAAVETTAREKPQLILMDLQMPEMDGYEAMREIRRQEGGESIPIIALTSYALSGDREKALETGFSTYIEKPIEIETFLERLAPYLASEG